MAGFMDLPREIISLICSLLKQAAKYNCSFVNKDFNAAAIPELWREPILSSNSNLNKLIKCLKLSKKGEYVRALKFGYKLPLNDDDLLQLLPLIPNLEVFEIRKAEELTDKSIIPLSRQCQQLKSFGVTGASVTYRSMHNLGCHCRHITKLTLASCSNLTSISLLPFVDMPIEYLDLSGCKWLNASDTAYDISCLHSLTHLNLVCCDTINHDFIRSMVTASAATTTPPAVGGGGGGNSDATTTTTTTTTIGLDNNSYHRYQRSKACLSKLQEFSITGGATLIDDNAIIPFIKTHPHVRGLFLLECAITDATLEAIATHMSFSLHHLDLSFCRHLTANGVRHLISHCHHLRLLGLKSCGLTQHDFPEIPIRAYPPTSVTADHYPHLNTLNYIELNYIREEYENHPQREMTAGPPTTSSSAAIGGMEEDDEETTVVMDDEGRDEDVAESYGYIQQYLDSVVIQ